MILKVQHLIYFPAHDLPMGALPVEAAAGWAFGKMLLGLVHVGRDTVLDGFFNAFLSQLVAFETSGKRTAGTNPSNLIAFIIPPFHFAAKIAQVENLDDNS